MIAVISPTSSSNALTSSFFINLESTTNSSQKNALVSLLNHNTNL